MAGQTTLGQLLALLEISELVIAPDTGPAHMATIVENVNSMIATDFLIRKQPLKIHRSLAVETEFVSCRYE